MKVYIKSSRYVYEGSIADMYGNIVIRDVVLYTYATSEARARNNILSQAKAKRNLKQSAKLKLLGDVEELIDFTEEAAPGQDIMLTAMKLTIQCKRTHSFFPSWQEALEFISRVFCYLIQNRYIVCRRYRYAAR